MKKLLLFLLIALSGNVQNSFSWDSYSTHSTNLKISSVDSVFQYYPLNVGNRWTYYIFQNYSPGPGYRTAVITDVLAIRNHLYYKIKNDTYIFYGNQHYSSYSYNRIDSLNGNLYIFFINDSTECLIDSLNSVTGDSTYLACGGPTGRWYRYYSGSMNLFNQAFNTKSYGWSNYFEAGDSHAYARGLGYVKYEYAAHTAVVNETLRGCLINGVLYGDTTVYLSVSQISSEVPNSFSLSQNYPNPFNPSTNIKFQIHKSEFVKITIFDILGKEVQTLVNQQLSPGTYSVDFEGSNLPSGVYYYRLEAGNFIETKKMILIK